MRYTVELRPAARRYLARLPRPTQRLIIQRLEALEGDPRPDWAKPLAGDLKGRWSFRLGDCRVTYRIEADRLAVVVIEIGPRARVYGDTARRSS